MGTSRHANAGRRRVITLEDREFIRGAAAWAAETDVSRIDTGLSREEARRRAGELLQSLRGGEAPSSDGALTGVEIDILRAACEVLTQYFFSAVSENTPNSLKADLLNDVERLYGFISTARWHGTDFGERAEVLIACAFTGWRMARTEARWPVLAKWESRLEGAGRSAPDAQTRLTEFINIADSHGDHLAALEVLQPEMLPLLLYSLRGDWERLPDQTLRRARLLFDCLHAATRLEGVLADERLFVLGEVARIASRCYGFLSEFSEASAWLERAEQLFRVTCNSAPSLAKARYGRLVLALEKREFDSVLSQIDSLRDTFESLSMSEDVVKARIVKAVALKEDDRLEEAAHDLDQIVDQARRLDNSYLEAAALVNLLQVHAFRGEREAAIKCANEAINLTSKLGNPMVISKLHWGIGQLFRAQGETTAAIKAFRRCLSEFLQLGLWSDAAGVYLIIADVLLDSGQDKQAEWEVRQALPIIHEYKLVPEGFAAMTLLRESLRRQKIDRQALRNLHEHFEQKKH